MGSGSNASGNAMSTPSAAHAQPVKSVGSSPANSPAPIQALRSLTGSRLRKHADYQRAYAASRKRQSASMSWFLRRRMGERPAVDWSVSGGSARGLDGGQGAGQSPRTQSHQAPHARGAAAPCGACLPAGCDLILHPRAACLPSNLRNLRRRLCVSFSRHRPKQRGMNKPHGSLWRRQETRRGKAWTMTRLLLATLASIAAGFRRRCIPWARRVQVCAHVLRVRGRRRSQFTAPLKGSALAVWRLLRCHPFGRGGLDPVPPAAAARPFPHEPLP
jgi:ribonuclease P protein component